MLSAVAKVLKTVTGGGKVVTQAVAQTAAGLSGGLNAGTRAALLEASNSAIKAAAKTATEGVGSAVGSGLVNGLNVGTRVALAEGAQGTLRAATHATKGSIREIGETGVEILAEVPKGLINAAGLGGIASSGVGIALQGGVKAATKAAGKEISSLKVPAPVAAMPIPVKDAALSVVQEVAEVGAEVLNTTYEATVMQGGMGIADKIKAGIVGGG